MSTTNILDLNNRIDALEKIAHNVEPIQQQIDELKAWTDSGTKDASGNPIILTDGAAFKAVDLKVSLSPKQSGSGTPSPTNVRPITGYTEGVVTVKDEDETTQDTATIAFGQTVFGGSVDFKTGKVTVTHAIVDLGSYTWGFSSSYKSWYTDGIRDFKQGEEISGFRFAASAICDNYEYVQRIFIESDNGKTNMYFQPSTSFYRCWVRDLSTISMSAEEFETYITGKYICYELATPTELTLTPAELELLKGYNYITSNGDNIELTYQPDTLKADILLTVSQLYGSKISIMDGILTGGTTGQVLTKTSDDNYDATWETLPATRTTTKKSEK